MTERKYFHDFFGGEALPGDIAESIIMVNDPMIVVSLTEAFDKKVFVADHYEFRVVTGIWKDLPITVCSTGIGGGSTSIAIDNLVNLGAKTIIYVDVGKSMTNERCAYFATGAIREDGASLDYVHKEFPATADPEVLMAIIASSRVLGFEVEPALMWSSVGSMTQEKSQICHTYNTNLAATGLNFVAPILVSGPEVSTILTLSTLYRLRAGAIYVAINQIDMVNEVVQQYFNLALQAMLHLRDWDLEKYRLNWKIMTPSTLKE